MVTIPVCTNIIIWVLEHNRLSEGELIRRCHVVTATMLSGILSSSSATPEAAQDLAQAIEVPIEVITDATGKICEAYTITHQVLHEAGRLDDTSAYRTVVDHAARNTDGIPLNKQQVRNILQVSWNKQPSLL